MGNAKSTPLAEAANANARLIYLVGTSLKYKS
jgi:hypothetical protein